MLAFWISFSLLRANPVPLPLKNNKPQIWAHDTFHAREESFYAPIKQPRVESMHKTWGTCAIRHSLLIVFRLRSPFINNSFYIYCLFTDRNIFSRRTMWIKFSLRPFNLNSNWCVGDKLSVRSTCNLRWFPVLRFLVLVCSILRERAYLSFEPFDLNTKLQTSARAL